MPLFVAVDWDVREARVAAGTLRGGRLRIEQAFRIAWPGATVFDAETVVQRAAALRAALDARGLSKAEALVTIGRAAVELKQLTLPPAPDDELPGMVRFLAQREFHAFGPEWLLDFLPTPAAADEPRTVLAATVDPAAAAQVRQVCETAGLRLRRLLLRPGATASLTLRRLAGDDQTRLLVDPGAEEAEVTALAGTNIVLIRSTRMPGDPQSPDYRRALTAELRRTLASVHHQLAGRRVAAIELCGSRTEWDGAVEQLAADLSTPVEVVDPWRPLPGALELGGGVSIAEGRFAAVLGALADETEQAAPRFDFLNPRRPPAPPNRRRQALVGVLCATLVLAAIWLFVQMRLQGMDDEIAQLRQSSTSLTPLVKSAQELQRKVKDIEAWRRNDILWLGELERLSRQFPSNREAQLTLLRMAAHPLGGELHLTGIVSDAGVVDDLEKKLRDPAHIVEGKGRRQDATSPKYPWRFQSNVVVKPADSAKPAVSAAKAATAVPATKQGAE